MLGPVNLTLPAGGTITRQRTQAVPGSAAPGVYTYIGYVGVYSNVKLDSSFFTYTKLASGDRGAWVDEWSNYGESFEPWMTVALTEPLPQIYALKSAYPNPFNPQTTIRYDLPQAGSVKLQVYDLLGKKVADLVGGLVPAGSHQVVWQTRDLPSGLYVLRMQAGEFQAVQKLVLMK